MGNELSFEFTSVPIKHFTTNIIFELQKEWNAIKMVTLISAINPSPLLAHAK